MENISDKFFFASSLNKNNLFQKIKIEEIQESGTLVGSLEFNNLKYTFIETSKNDISLFVMGIGVKANIKNIKRSKLNEEILNLNKKYTNIKIKLDKTDSSFGFFRVEFSVISTIDIRNPMAIIQPSCEVLFVVFLELKEILEKNNKMD